MNRAARAGELLAHLLMSGEALVKNFIDSVLVSLKLCKPSCLNGVHAPNFGYAPLDLIFMELLKSIEFLPLHYCIYSWSAWLMMPA